MGTVNMTKTPKDIIADRDKMLDEYENSIGLPNMQAPGEQLELENYLSMDKKILESLSAEECGYIGYRLNQFAFYVQRVQNRELARVTWAENELKITIANEINNYTGYGYQEKSAQAIRGNDHASKVNKILVFAKQRAERMNFLSKGLNNLADMIHSIQFNKRSNND